MSEITVKYDVPGLVHAHRVYQAPGRPLFRGKIPAHATNVDVPIGFRLADLAYFAIVATVAMTVEMGGKTLKLQAGRVVDWEPSDPYALPLEADVTRAAATNPGDQEGELIILAMLDPPPMPAPKPAAKPVPAPKAEAKE